MINNLILNTDSVYLAPVVAFLDAALSDRTFPVLSFY